MKCMKCKRKEAKYRCSSCLEYVCEDCFNSKKKECNHCSKLTDRMKEKETLILIPFSSSYAFVSTDIGKVRKVLRKIRAIKIENNIFAIEKEKLAVVHKGKVIKLFQGDEDE